jgi:hypothetical protein
MSTGKVFRNLKTKEFLPRSLQTLHAKKMQFKHIFLFFSRKRNAVNLQAQVTSQGSAYWDYRRLQTFSSLTLPILR